MNRSKLMMPALIATILAGCASDPQKAPFTPQGDPLAKANYPRVVVEKPLADWLVVSEPVVKSDSGPLSVTVPIRMTSSHPDEFARAQYRFIFLDSSGVPLRSQADWTYQRFEPRNQVFLKGNALDAAATDWRCEIRSAR